MRFRVTIIDYGAGNLLSVTRALEHVGASVVISSDPEVILNSDKVLLPGVGAFGSAMSKLEELDLVKTLKLLVQNNTQLLGICLGMQLLFDSSDEFGQVDGLSILPGRVKSITSMSDNASMKVPHIGWNEVVALDSSLSFIKETVSYSYFVHSFMAVPSRGTDVLAITNYRDLSIPAIVGLNNVFGCQFHPEKSGHFGLSLLRWFCEKGSLEASS